MKKNRFLMKKQNKTYLLLAVVLGIWGSIGFKFLSAVNPSTQEIAQVTSDQIFVPKDIKEREVFSIVADYRDPFLGTVKAPKKVAKKTSKEPVVKKAPIPTKSIQYTGFITDKSSKQKIFFVTIDGQQQMMSLNDTFQEVKLIRGTKSSIRVKYDGRTQNISLTE